MKYFCSLLIAVLLCLPLIASGPAPEVLATQKKLDYIQSNGALPHPDEHPTEFTEEEINRYLASDLITLPAGVQSARFSGASGAVTATARVDFDQVRAGKHSSNPLLMVFSGTHEVLIAAHAHGAGHQGFVHVDSVQLDGVEIPEFVLQLFAQKYLQSKNATIGIDSQFPLPNRIDTAIIADHKLVITQK